MPHSSTPKYWLLLSIFVILGSNLIVHSAKAQQDGDCSMHAIGYLVGIPPEEVAARTGYMQGPSHNESDITDMMARLNIGNGMHPHFTSRQAAYDYMNARNDGRDTYYIIAYIPPGEGVGHVIDARSSVAGSSRRLTFIDCQQLNNNEPPDNCPLYIVWFGRFLP
ncbi:hypothetical protein [Roseiarcus fermentans]|uniref:hypothetical protein n=1 Tax=Roseiarcus fermentans TaxID=1473586 RepID=UPI0011BE4986|nr:hypothetical protein [Roseiarcus fermentans]